LPDLTIAYDQEFRMQATRRPFGLADNEQPLVEAFDHRVCAAWQRDARSRTKWYPLLVDELNLVAAAGARIAAVGNLADNYLKRRQARREFPWSFMKVMHYSALAAPARAA
jgi:hypothetical protein